MNRWMRMRLILVCVFMLRASVSLGEWELKHMGDKRDSVIRKVHFITPEQGWAVGNRTYWTEDGGETWTRRDLDISPRAFFLNTLDGWQQLGFDEQGGHLIRGPYPPIGVQMPFQRTYNGGLSWVQMSGTITEVIEINAPPRPEEVRFFSTDAQRMTFYFLDSQTGFAAGSTSLYGGMPLTRDAFRAYYIGKTTDGGKTWKLHIHWGNWNDIPLPIRKIEFVDVQYGWVLTDVTTLYRTQDGGETWQPIHLPRSGFRIDFTTPKEGWMTVRYLARRTEGELWHTTNGGRTWDVVFHIFMGRPFDIVFVNPQEGWIALYGQVPELGIDDPSFKGVLHTKDGGRTWEVEKIPTWIGYFTYDMLTQTLWVGGWYDALYKRAAPVVGLSPHGKLPLSWGQLKLR